MTLAEMAAMVCGKTRQSDAGAVAKCKTYLRQRYLMIAEGELWKDLIFALPFTFDMEETVAANLFGPNYWSRGAGVWHLPASVDKVLAVRSAAAGMDVADQYQFFRTTLDEFSETGDPIKFYVEQRVVADLRGLLTTVEAEGVTLQNSAPDNQAYKVRYIDLDGEVQTLSGNLEAAGGISNTFYPQVILSGTKAATGGGVWFALDGDIVNTAAAAATSWTRYPTVRVVPRPESNVELRALVKRKAIELTDDEDAPEIDGVDNALMAFAEADMYQRARQLGKSQAKAGEAVALLQQLKAVAVAQQANRLQIVPHVGEVSGSVWDGVGDKGHW